MKPAPADSQAADAPPARRVVLVGASNLTKGIGTVLDTSTRIWGGPLQVLAALGHGRSYGQETRFFGMALPGIEACGLWRDLKAEPETPTAALVTDIGNDLLYEQPVATIVGWVERCLDRLAAARARTVVTLLPVDNVRTLSAGRFHLLRTLFFPTSRIGLAEVVRRAGELNQQVERMAQRAGFNWRSITAAGTDSIRSTFVFAIVGPHGVRS